MCHSTALVLRVERCRRKPRDAAGQGCGRARPCESSRRFTRFALFYDEPLGRALYLGGFHAVSSFNNAGFALLTDNMIPFATDPWICVPLAVVAHLVAGRMMDYIEFEDDFAMVKTVASHDLLGRPLSETGIRTRHGITVVGVKRPGEDFTYATQDTVLHRGDVLIVSGRVNAVEAFANRT